MKFSVSILLFFYCSLCLQAQQVYYPVGSWQAVQQYRDNITSFKPFKDDVQLNQFRRAVFTPNDSGMQLEIIASGRSDQPVLKYFYKEKGALLKLEESGKYAVLINPVLHVSGGRDDSGLIYRNTRGIELAGNIGGQNRGLGFYSLLSENQELYPSQYRPLTDSLNFVPNEFFYKPFKKQGGVDYFQARGYITFKAVKEYIRFQFGHDKHKIGNGYRSLILSDFAPQFLFLKINTDVGRLHYQNLFTQFTDNGPVLSNILYGKKYAALHRLSFDVRHNLNIGMNEMVVFDRIDSTQSNQFDFNYLNPVIFYRSIESNLGSRDNSLMALDFHWKIRSRYVVYGQFLLDEFNLRFLKTRPNWWANKYGYQIGVRAINLLKVNNLDLLMEYNRVRPYTYSHMRSTQSYTHFNQPLAHPLGANFSEGIAELKYRAGEKWFFQTSLVAAMMGKDSFLQGRNYGSNLLRSYDTRASEYNAQMFMGKKTPLLVYDVMLSFMPRYNLFLDARLNYRKAGEVGSLFFSLGLRLNAEIRKFDY